MFDFLIYPLIFRTPPHNPGQHPRQDPGQGVGFNSSIELFFFFYLKQAMRPARICAQAAALVPCCALIFLRTYSLFYFRLSVHRTPAGCSFFFVSQKTHPSGVLPTTLSYTPRFPTNRPFLLSIMITQQPCLATLLLNMNNASQKP